MIEVNMGSGLATPLLIFLFVQCSINFIGILCASAVLRIRKTRNQIFV